MFSRLFVFYYRKLSGTAIGIGALFTEFPPPAGTGAVVGFEGCTGA